MDATWPAVAAAIDFGTHGTGYAWIEVRPGHRVASQRHPHFRDRWPGTDRFYPKTLTALLLDAGGAVVDWGYEAKDRWNELSHERRHRDHTFVSGFKMALTPDPYHGMTPPGTGSTTIDSPARAFPLIVGYLRRMYRVALADIQGSGYLASQIRWCVTVPAIWDDEDKQLMRDAARAAGMPAEPDRLLLAIEPEVAALHCQVHVARVLGTRREMNAVDGARRLMVVDCGGGTVDITAYRVDRGPAGSSRLTEIGKVSGGKLGSEYINQAFIDTVLAGRLGGAEALARIRRECPHGLDSLVDRWEAAKVTAAVAVDGAGEPVFTRPVYVEVPGEIRDLLDPAALQRLRDRPPHSVNRIAVTPDECRALFDRVVTDIVGLVGEQLREMAARDGAPAGPERLLLVGGMSASAYLQLRLRLALGDRATLMVPTDPAAAVLFGAVHYAYDPTTVRARRSRYTYGCATTEPFQDGVDPGEKLILDDEGRPRCDRRFHVFVRNGDTVAADASTGSAFSPIHDTARALTFEFYRTTSGSPRYVDEPDCERVGTVTVDLDTAMGLPLADRSVMALLRFGQTEIGVQGINMHTMREVTTTLRFDTTY